MLISNLPSVRRPVRFSALSFTLRILENAGLMKQPLQIEALLAAARRQTGLDDFGDETFLEPLSRLLDSCENEAHLNTIGRCALSQDTPTTSYQSIVYSARPWAVAADRGGSDYCTAVHHGIAAHRDNAVAQPPGAGPQPVLCAGNLGSDVSFAAAIPRGKEADKASGEKAGRVRLVSSGIS